MNTNVCCPVFISSTLLRLRTSADTQQNQHWLRVWQFLFTFSKRSIEHVTFMYNLLKKQLKVLHVIVLFWRSHNGGLMYYYFPYIFCIYMWSAILKLKQQEFDCFQVNSTDPVAQLLWLAELYNCILAYKNKWQLNIVLLLEVSCLGVQLVVNCTFIMMVLVSGDLHL